MRYYISIMSKVDEKTHRLSFPDFPDISASSNTLSKAISSATEDLDRRLIRLQDVTPSTLDQVISRSDVKQELSEGAFVILIPHSPADGHAEWLGGTFDQGLADAIDAVAKDQGLTRADLLSEKAGEE